MLPTLLTYCTTSRSTDGRPNVLIIVTDDQRASGTLQVMPQTRRWFQQGGITFRNTFATTPLCCPARASILTGRYAHNHGIQTRVLPGDGTLSPEGSFQRSTVQRYLHEAGYRTALFGKYLNGWPVPVDPPYFDEWAVIRVPPGVSYYGGIVNLNGHVERMRQYNTSFIRDQAISFLRRTSPIGQPWFLYVAVKAPHEPFTVEPEHEEAAVPPPRTNPAIEETDRSDKPPFVRTEPAPHRKIKQLRELQLRTLMSVDDMVGALFGELQRLGELDDTLAIFTSDNGISWGEHRLGGKLLPYTESAGVPLLLRWPGRVPAGTNDDRIAANIDLVPTILAASGIRPSPDLPVDGRSLLAPGTREQLFLEYWTWGSRRPIPDWASTRSRAFQYTEYYDRAGRIIFREYYDLRRDRWQLKNLLRQGERPTDSEIQRLSRQLALARRCAGTGCW
jgi:arylsulfatase A-like enzyme